MIFQENSFVLVIYGIVFLFFHQFYEIYCFKYCMNGPLAGIEKKGSCEIGSKSRSEPCGPACIGNSSYNGVILSILFKNTVAWRFHAFIDPRYSCVKICLTLVNSSWVLYVLLNREAFFPLFLFCTNFGNQVSTM